MTSDSDFKINFDRARGLKYEDAIGILLFSYDFAMPDGKQIILYKAKLMGNLKPIPSNLSETEQVRIQLAFERVKQYVVACGYKIYDSSE